MRKSALITGITGQDGAYLAARLVDQGYQVFGLLRRGTRYAFENLDYLGVTSDVQFVEGDMTDQGSLNRIVRKTRPAEVYNLAAQSFVGSSWDEPIVTTNVNAMGVLYLLEAVKEFAPQARFYQASTSEMFGNSSTNGLQKLETPFHPRSPYAIAKLYAYWLVTNYRESYGMYAVNGVLFNHESPIRGKEFVTRKISWNVAKIKLGLAERFGLGNLDSLRDWGFAGDYVKAMHLMLQQPTAQDYMLATGETHSVREFVEAAFQHVGIVDWQKHVYIDPAFQRPAELHALHGDPSYARRVLNWEPEVTFHQLVAMMVDADLARLRSVAEREAEPVA